MWYKKGEQVGIKCKFGENKGKQVITFGGKTSAKNKEELLELGKQCVEKLNSGTSLEDVKIWVRNEAK